MEGSQYIRAKVRGCGRLLPTIAILINLSLPILCEATVFPVLAAQDDESQYAELTVAEGLLCHVKLKTPSITERPDERRICTHYLQISTNLIGICPPRLVPCNKSYSDIVCGCIDTPIRI